MKANYLRDEKGVALVVALVILLVLTVIGFVAISTSTFEATIVGNERIGPMPFTPPKRSSRWRTIRFRT